MLKLHYIQLMKIFYIKLNSKQNQLQYYRVNIINKTNITQNLTLHRRLCRKFDLFTQKQKTYEVFKMNIKIRLEDS